MMNVHHTQTGFAACRCVYGSLAGSSGHHGFALVEYLLALGVVISVLALPIGGSEQSVITWVISALNGFQHHTAVLLSIP